MVLLLVFQYRRGGFIYSSRNLFRGDPDSTMYTRVMSETKETMGRGNIRKAYDKRRYYKCESCWSCKKAMKKSQ